LRAELERYRPDVVISTYPLATAGVAWLRRRGDVRAPLLALLSDFAPHRFWVYPGVDEYMVLSEPGRSALERLAPQAPVRVCPPAVDDRFRPPSEHRGRMARERLRLPADRLTVLVSGGSMAMGSIRRTVRAVRAAGAHAVVLCGTNARLLRSLRRIEHEGLLTAVEWTDDMPELMSACDVVVNNAGGAIAAEALAAGRALVMFRPIPGHGRASARLLADAGLAPAVRDHRSLTDLLVEWATQPEALKRLQREVTGYAVAHSPAEFVDAVLDRAEDGALR
jgi:UDP-N-acetylglucosamine:LPS N-acetylglucosamine transferase